jgi:4,5-epoxidase
MLAEAVTWGCRVLSVEDTGETAVARLGDGSVIRARWVIGADGAHSVVRKSAEIGFPGVQMIELHFLADVHADLDTPRDAVAFWASPVGVMGAFPLPGDNNAWRLMAPAADPDRSDPAPRDILAELEAGLAPHGGIIRSVEWASSFRMRVRPHGHLAWRGRDPTGGKSPVVVGFRALGECAEASLGVSLPVSGWAIA